MSEFKSFHCTAHQIFNAPCFPSIRDLNTFQCGAMPRENSRSIKISEEPSYARSTSDGNQASSEEIANELKNRKSVRVNVRIAAEPAFKMRLSYRHNFNVTLISKVKKTYQKKKPNLSRQTRTD